jgi:hypothetical protein
VTLPLVGAAESFPVEYIRHMRTSDPAGACPKPALVVAARRRDTS